mgnify:CR=1 FL=1
MDQQAGVSGTVTGPQSKVVRAALTTSVVVAQTSTVVVVTGGRTEPLSGPG